MRMLAWASRLLSHLSLCCLLALGKYTGHFPTSPLRPLLINFSLPWYAWGTYDEPQKNPGNSLPVINTSGSGDGTKISKPQARNSRPTTHPTKGGRPRRAQAYMGLTTPKTKKAKSQAFPSPARPCLCQTDVCQTGNQLIASAKRNTRDAKTTGKLGVALASDGHIHRQLPSETETPENAGER